MYLKIHVFFTIHFFLTFQTRIDDGKWHRLRILRKRRIGILQVDKLKPSRGRSEEGASMLNTDGKIWFGKWFFFTFFFLSKSFFTNISGGKHSLPSGLPTQYYHGYVGCIKKVKVFRRKLDLLRQGDNSNLKLCDSR